MGVCGNVCCVAAVVKDSGFLEPGSVDVLFSVCIVTRGAVGVRVWEVCVFRHADIVCNCLCASCGRSQCCILHDLQFVNAG